MNLAKYRVELDDNRRNILVKEAEMEYDGEGLYDPLAVAKLMKENFRLHVQAEEHLYLIALSMSCKPLGVFEISHGGINYSYAGPREIFIRILLAGASGFMLCHNHPSGECQPSNADIRMTERIKECAELMSVELIDHIIIGDQCYSFRINGRLM